MLFVLARVHAGTVGSNGTVMKSGSQTKYAGNVPYLQNVRTDTKEVLKRIFFDKANPQKSFEILENFEKNFRKFRDLVENDENPQDRDVFTNIYRENNRRPLSP